MAQSTFRFTLIFILIAALLSGCAVNPVTGRKELSLVSESYEISVGQEQYVPSRQMSGGDYTADSSITRYVRSVGERLAAVSDRQLPYEFVVVNDSTPNAWALPGGKIAVHRGLLTELNNEAELAAVLGHEIVHAAARHGAKSMERGLLIQGAVLAVGLAAQGSDYAGQVVGGAQLAAGLITQKYGRDAEREADYYGMQYMSRAGYNPQAAVGLQETFVRLSENRRQDWLSGLFASHPPSMERVNANRQTARSLPAGGEWGAERYRQQIDHLLKTREAYADYDRARTLLREGKIAEAQSLLTKAMAAEPNEALFYALAGDIRFRQKQYRAALTEYDRAIQRDSGFFHFYVQRGLTRAALDNPAGAGQDLERSIKLLPTAMAYKGLGDLAMARGNRQQAIQHYRAASGSDSQTGREAARQLARLEIPEKPNQYLNVSAALNGRERLVAVVENPTSVPVRSVRLRFLYRDATGKNRSLDRTLKGWIQPGKRARIGIGLKLFKGLAAPENIQVTIVSARVK